MKTTIAGAAALLVPVLSLAGEPYRLPMHRLASTHFAPTPADWIDLGDENARLYLAADYTPRSPHGSTALRLSTNKGAERLRLDVQASGKTHLWLYPHSVSGPSIDPSKPHRVLVRIVSHRDTADEVFVKFAPGTALPAEPEDDTGWTLINRTGSSNANLASLTIEAGDGTNMSKVRLAASYAQLKVAPPNPSGTSANTVPVSTNATPEQGASTPQSSTPEAPKITHENYYQIDELVARGADPNAHYYLYPGLP